MAMIIIIIMIIYSDKKWKVVFYEWAEDQRWKYLSAHYIII